MVSTMTKMTTIEDENEDDDFDENDDDEEERYIFNSVDRVLTRDSCSTAAPPFFFSFLPFFTFRESEDEFPKDDDELGNDQESDKDTSDDETR